jgi:RES domain-containing protein
VLARVQLPDEVPATPSDASDELEAGDIWLRNAKAATMRVPSALVPFAYNLLLNPHHPRAAEASVVSLTPCPLRSTSVAGSTRRLTTVWR